MTYKKYALILVGAFVLLTSIGVHAGPTAIRDDRVTDLAVTPALGRGYSIATSTYQSLCMANIVTTKPSYNFKYSFEQLDENGNRKSNVKTSGSASARRSFFGFHVDVKSSGSSDKTKETTKKTKRILVTIEMDVYYASLNEALSRLSGSASTLLQNDDIPGFFDSCGPYYIRSIGRHAKFVSMFSYESQTEKLDSQLEASLEVAIKGWGTDASFSGSTSRSLSTMASKAKLKIDTAAWGLGKDSSAQLISYDLTTFKAAIKKAFTSMMDERTGMVTSIEVVPWVENTEFQSKIKLKDFLKEDPTTGKKTETVNVYMQKRIMNENAEFLAEMSRATRNRLNIYYKARLCQLRIAQDFGQGDKKGGGEIALKKEFAKQLLLNNRTGKVEKLTLTALLAEVNKTKVDDFLKEYETFVYGKSLSGGGGGGAGKASVMQCMKDLKKANFRVTSFREVNSCRTLESRFAAILGRTVDDYCMPRLAGGG